MSRHIQILKKQILTEKSSKLAADKNQYVFLVSPTANKKNISAAVTEAFGVKVERVRVLNVTCKTKLIRSRKRRIYSSKRIGKKAIIRLANGEKIELAQN